MQQRQVTGIWNGKDELPVSENAFFMKNAHVSSVLSVIYPFQFYSINHFSNNNNKKHNYFYT